MLQLKHLCFVMVDIACKAGCMLNVHLFLSFKLLLIVLHSIFKSGKFTVHMALQVLLLRVMLLS